MAKRRVQLGSTGEAVRRNLTRLRQTLFNDGRDSEGVFDSEGAFVTKVQLARRLADTDRPLTANTVSEVENGARRVDVDDLTALAAALGVSPLFLLLPHEFREGETVQLAGVGEVAVRDAWAWMRDGLPLSAEFRAMAERFPGAHPFELHADPVGHHRDVLRALMGDDVDGDARAVVHDLEVVFWRRLLEVGAFDQRVTFARFRRHFERMMRELADAEGVADRWGVDVPDDESGEG
jgi:transcriptional regulator with XRE-family HTH domain